MHSYRKKFCCNLFEVIPYVYWTTIAPGGKPERGNNSIAPLNGDLMLKALVVFVVKGTC